jgi:hypothetical protein
MTDTALPSESNKFPPAALFLETSAQILRLRGRHSKIRNGINDLINATRLNSGQIGTSAQVIREFHYVINGFFDAVRKRIALLDDRETDRPFEELWTEVRDDLMPMVFPGGRSLLEDLGDSLTNLYQGRLMRSAFLDSVVATLRVDMLRGFRAILRQTRVFDMSTCDVWEPPHGSCSKCKEEPSHECRLKETAVINRGNFVASLETLAAARRAESEWIKANLETLRQLEGKALHEFVGKHAGHVGDPIIFWEVPDGWTILSRDRTFEILRDAHRTEIKFFMVRIPRKQSGEACTLELEGIADAVEGTLDNYNSKGARIHAPSLTVRENQRIIIEAGNALSRREGAVTKFYEPSSREEEEKNEARPTFGLKFKASK